MGLHKSQEAHLRTTHSQLRLNDAERRGVNLIAHACKARKLAELVGLHILVQGFEMKSLMQATTW